MKFVTTLYHPRLAAFAVALLLGIGVAGCELINQPTDANSPTINYDGSLDDAAMTEVGQNPTYSEFYTEPDVGYGAPGDGLADLGGDQGDTHLASFQYTAPEGVKAGVVAGALADANKLLSNAGVIGTGTAITQDGSQRVMVFVQDAHSATLVPAKINGVATEVRVTGKITALGYTGTYRPTVPSGVSVGNSRENSSGTIGAIVVRNGIRYMLSNNHVLARSNQAVIGEPIVQPGRADNYGRPTGQIGVLSAYKKVTFSSSNIFDAAVARLTVQNSYDEADQFAPSRTPVNPQVGMQVMKVGRTTGITYGAIAATNVTVKVDYDGRTATFTNQIYIPGAFLRAGDSGSLLVSTDGNHPVGLCFAGGDDGAFANPIGPVLQYFGVKIAGTNN